MDAPNKLSKMEPRNPEIATTRNPNNHEGCTVFKLRRPGKFATSARSKPSPAIKAEPANAARVPILDTPPDVPFSTDRCKSRIQRGRSLDNVPISIDHVSAFGAAMAVITAYAKIVPARASSGVGRIKMMIKNSPTQIHAGKPLAMTWITSRSFPFSTLSMTSFFSARPILERTLLDMKNASNKPKKTGSTSHIDHPMANAIKPALRVRCCFFHAHAMIARLRTNPATIQVRNSHHVALP